MTLTLKHCDDCTPSHLKRGLRSHAATAVVISSLPFVFTFLIVSGIVLEKLFPLLSGSVQSKGRPEHPLSLSKFRFRSPSTYSVSSISAICFSTTIALSAVLAELILCEISNALNPDARGVALQVTVSTLLVLLIIFIPFLELHSLISSAGWKFTGSGKGRLRLAWGLQIAGFSLWILGFWWIGQGLLGIHGHDNAAGSLQSLIESCLERIGVIGVSLMALLSGFASVSSLWQNFGVKPRLVTETDVARKKAGLDATSEMLMAKRSRLRALERKMSEAPSESFFKKAIGTIRGNADTQERKSLVFEISGLETMARSLGTSLSLLRNRRQQQHRASTPTGRVLILVSYLFSFYCLYRILATSVTTIRRWWYVSSTFSGSDPVNNVLALIAKHWDPSLDQASWSRQISFLLSGIILLASFSSVLQTFHFFARFTPSLLYTAQANLALLVAQVCGMYVISSALLLRGMMPREVGSVISSALGAGEAVEMGWVDRWFEGWFLTAAALTALGIFLGRKLGGGSEWDDDEDIERGKEL
ncbi:hypothetical protein MMC16_002175 [Acarospora aff. strigata]|nr:hypothetical protein [Acarospora aff. strigata]